MDSVVLGGEGRKICHSHGSQAMLPPPSRAHTLSTIVLKYARGPDLSGTTQGTTPPHSCQGLSAWHLLELMPRNIGGMKERRDE